QEQNRRIGSHIPALLFSDSSDSTAVSFLRSRHKGYWHQQDQHREIEIARALNSRTNRNRRGADGDGRGAGGVGAAAGEDPRPQAGHDAGTPHRQNAPRMNTPLPAPVTRSELRLCFSEIRKRAGHGASRSSATSRPLENEQRELAHFLAAIGQRL